MTRVARGRRAGRTSRRRSSPRRASGCGVAVVAVVVVVIGSTAVALVGFVGRRATHRSPTTAPDGGRCAAARQQCWPEAIELLAGAVRAGDTLPAAVGARRASEGPGRSDRRSAPWSRTIGSRATSSGALDRLGRRPRRPDGRPGRRHARDRAPRRRARARAGAAHARRVPARGPCGPQGDRGAPVVDARRGTGSPPRRRGSCSSSSRAARRVPARTTRSPGSSCLAGGAVATVVGLPPDGRARPASRGAACPASRPRPSVVSVRPMSPLRAIVVVGSGLLGLAALVSCLPRFRRPTLAERLAPYLGALGPRRSRLLLPRRARGAGHRRRVPARCSTTSARGCSDCFGDDGRDLAGRLAAAGSTLTPSGFRAEQATWGLAGFVGGVGAHARLVAIGRTRRRRWPRCSSRSAFGGDRVSWRGTVRSPGRSRRAASRARSEFPTVVDLVCLAVTAGESLRGALELVAGVGERPAGVRDADRRCACRAAVCRSPTRSRRAPRSSVCRRSTVSSARSSRRRSAACRSAEALRAMAFDVREAEKRDVIEAAGRKQVSMLVPVDRSDPARWRSSSRSSPV